MTGQTGHRALTAVPSRRTIRLIGFHYHLLRIGSGIGATIELNTDRDELVAPTKSCCGFLFSGRHRERFFEWNKDRDFDQRNDVADR